MNVIEVKDVHKSFKIYYDKGATLKERILFQKRNSHEIHEVLKGINLNIEQGEVIGLIGKNGCGKSTLLKLMTRIIYPDKGSIEVKGKVSSLLELGAGFHPDMSGRENIYTNASIFGLNKKEIDDRLENIIEFSELGEFIDNPVRTYSSGMYMRLAFSVAINVDAEILLVDEILAVGDAAFQAKCFNKMEEIKNKGTTIVIVSHDLSSIQRLCDRAIWIENGQIAEEGKPKHVTSMYLDNIMKNGSVTTSLQVQDDNEFIQITDVILTDAHKHITNKFETEEMIEIKVCYNNKSLSTLQQIQDAGLSLSITRNDGVFCYGTDSFADGVPLISLKEQGSIIFSITKNRLLRGKYIGEIYFTTIDKIIQSNKYKLEFEVYTKLNDTGVARLEHRWDTSLN